MCQFCAKNDFRNFFSNKTGKKKTGTFFSMELFGTKRLLNKIGMINIDDFKNMKNKFKELIDYTPPHEGGLSRRNLEYNYN
ncbi:hypothetical protein CRV03_03525 [Arcobacter sp. F155]|nr:hypothetical protein CRV03_03525 [Arcobacter sp. F155]